MPSAVGSSSSHPLPASQPPVSLQISLSPQHRSGTEAAARTASARDLPVYRVGNRAQLQKLLIKNDLQQLLRDNLQGPHIPRSGNVSLATPEGQVIAAFRHNGYVLLNPETQEPVRHPSGQLVWLMKISNGKFVVMPQTLGGFDVSDIPPWVAEQILQYGVTEVRWDARNGTQYGIYKTWDQYRESYYYCVLSSSNGWTSVVAEPTEQDLGGWGNAPSFSYSHMQASMPEAAAEDTGMTVDESESGQFARQFASLEHLVSTLNRMPAETRSQYVRLRQAGNSAALTFTSNGMQYYIDLNRGGVAEIYCSNGQTVYAWRGGRWVDA